VRWRALVAAVATSALLSVSACTGGDDADPTPAPPPPVTAAPAGDGRYVGPDPLVVWTPVAPPVWREQGWLRETLAVSLGEDRELLVRPVSSSMTLEYVDDARSLAIWIVVENPQDEDWTGNLGVDATLTDEQGNTFLPVTDPTPADLHPNPGLHGYSNDLLTRQITVPAGESFQGTIVFRPTGGNRPTRLNITLDGERTTSWVVNLGQL
jgi:hypothetical protein